MYMASKQVKQAVKDAQHPTQQPPTSTTDDTPDFNRMKVSLQVPDALFGSSFTLVTNLSTRVGNLIMNTARRTGEILWVIQPLIGKNLTIQIPTTTTTTRRTTTRTTTTTTARPTTTTTATTAAASGSSSVQTNEIK
ncbi:salivary glue protein Sgs-3-like [Topomyia yanbarensis]|uniref:salivary glue protein Sgs-3-like n=1 Tax=Topomyia yanbarensis TaxID=2498891 RepID=UPI00273B027B|nr:salivary glue protein Sgs-3-like [Topomyia yanbarensis]